MGGESSSNKKVGGGELSRSSGGEMPRGRIIWESVFCLCLNLYLFEPANTILPIDLLGILFITTMMYITDELLSKTYFFN